MASKAGRDAQKDSVGVYGRFHKGKTIKGSYVNEGRRVTFVRETIPEHHSYDTHIPSCPTCSKDVSKGIHPNAPK